MTARVGSLPDGSRGVDVNSTLTLSSATLLRRAGYSFAVRYVRRQHHHPFDLTASEAISVVQAGLGLMVVQHVAPDPWIPTAGLGAAYGIVAAAECKNVGIPEGVTVWCDLEGVKPGTDPAQTIAFCNNWHAALTHSRYRPGLYVGYHCGLSARDLYYKLRFTRYWGAYNINRDEAPVERGFCMTQHVASSSDLVHGFTNQTLDVDLIHVDAKGGTPSLLLP